MHSIGDVCDMIGLKPHVLRYWEQVIPMLAPRKNQAGHRLYSDTDIQLLLRIRHLLYDEKYTLKGVKEKILQEMQAKKPNAKSKISAARAGLIEAVRIIREGRRRTMNTENIIDLFKQRGHGHLFAAWALRTEAERERLVRDLHALDLDLLSDLQRNLSNESIAHVRHRPTSYNALGHPSRDSDSREIGERLISSGKTAFLTVAGGQGSRLGFDGPKGLFRISPIRQASLFQIFSEKLLATGRKYGQSIPWYIMTSMQNHENTIEYFEKNAYFGLDKNHVIFFPQGELPSLDASGKLMLSERGGLLKNPDGHGGVVQALKRHGYLDRMAAGGIEEISCFQADNPLVNVPDPMFLGVHRKLGSQVSTKVLRKISPEEKLGSIGEVDGKKIVIEYSDLDRQDMFATDDSGELLFSHGSIAIHVFNVSFLRKPALTLPYHIARKNVKTLMYADGKVEVVEKEGIKLEMFVFDLIPQADNALFYEADRIEEFAPLKNREGADSVDTCIAGQIEKAARRLEQCGVTVSRKASGESLHKLEISPLFALDLDGLCERLAGHDVEIDKDRLFI